MISRAIRNTLVAPLLTAAWAATAMLQAASVPQMELEQLVENSPRIVHGRALRTWSAWDAGHHAIWTHAEVEVLRDLRGGAGATIVISELGGEADGLQMHAPGAPRLQAGEEVVLFAYPAATGLWRMRGWSQGRYLVERDRSGRAFVRRDDAGLTLLPPKAPAPAAQTTAASPPQPLDQFLDRVEALLRQEAER